MKTRIKATLASLTIALGIGVTDARAGGSESNFGCDRPAAAPAASASQTEFDTYSWQMFIALNWPAKSGQRGVADCAKAFGSSFDTVWRSYKFIGEIFLPDAENPGTWNSGSVSTQLTEVAKASKDVASSPLGTVLQPVAGWLIDQQGNPTYYQIAVDKTSYDYITTNTLYNADIANADATINFPNGATEIKASWRILTAKDDTGRYMTMSATVDTFDSTGTVNGTAEATLGLVGLHILTKPAGFPQWIWATFEQIDNLAAPSGGQASYADPTAPASDVNQSPCAGHEIPCVPKTGKTFQSPDPLSRVTTISAATAGVNATLQADFGDTFAKYYELVGTQWPSDPNDPGNPLGTPTPNVLANTTMESYIQPISSCMACHSTAISGANRYKSDFSFVFIHAQSPSN
jgi:hypothetical protein